MVLGQGDVGHLQRCHAVSELDRNNIVHRSTNMDKL